MTALAIVLFGAGVVVTLDFNAREAVLATMSGFGRKNVEVPRPAEVMFAVAALVAVAGLLR